MKRGTRIVFTSFRVALAVGLLLYLGFSGAVDWSAFWGMLEAWPVMLLALTLVLITLVVTAWRLCVMMKATDLHLSLGNSVRLTLIGNFFNTCLPGGAGGDVVKIYYAVKGNQGRRMEVATVILLDRVVGMFAMILWPVLAAFFFISTIKTLPVLQGILWAGAAGIVLMLVLFAVAMMDRVRNNRLLVRTLKKLPMGSHLENVMDTVRAYRSHTGTLLAATGISLLAHSLAISVTLLVATAVIPGGVDWLMSLLIPLGFLVNILPLTPGGLGVGEAAFDTLFVIAGLSGGAEVMLGWRLLLIISGLFGLVFYLQGRQHYIQTQKLASKAEDLVPVPERILIHSRTIGKDGNTVFVTTDIPSSVTQNGNHSPG